MFCHLGAAYNVAQIRSRLPPFGMSLKKNSPANCVVQRLSVSPELPPILSSPLCRRITSQLLALWLYSLANNRVGFRVLLGSLLWPIPKIDNPTAGHLLELGIEILPVEVREDNVCVARIALKYRECLFFTEHKPHPEYDRALKRDSLVRFELLG